MKRFVSILKNTPEDFSELVQVEENKPREESEPDENLNGTIVFDADFDIDSI